ncbi:DNA polymerase beta superfamily protein [Bacillus thuringiensis]|uniref:DNA polymerase beta superfamily protein n=1 Tax=Bacillus thuringiensis TaxID=1428 RepID=UPI0021D696D3|nr:nucleotidyltransferase domain-containing protein [Bacillus thuringiensis]MCU7667791.1 nucleotidyltransferase domain-containing protein [Bacillus thuringiensis]
MKLFDREVVVQFLSGSHSRNLNTETSDKDYKAFVLPTFEDLYAKIQFKDTQVTPTIDTEVHDIRALENLFYKSNITYLELLYSIEIQKYGYDEMEEILAMRDDIVTMHLGNFFNASFGMYNSQMKILRNLENNLNPSNLQQYNKKAMLAIHFLSTLIKFYETGFSDFKSSFTYNDAERAYMLGIKQGDHSIEEVKHIIQSKADQTKALESLYLKQPVNEATLEKIQKLTRSMVLKSLQ